MPHSAAFAFSLLDLESTLHAVVGSLSLSALKYWLKPSGRPRGRDGERRFLETQAAASAEAAGKAVWGESAAVLLASLSSSSGKAALTIAAEVAGLSAVLGCRCLPSIAGAAALCASVNYSLLALHAHYAATLGRARAEAAKLDLLVSQTLHFLGKGRHAHFERFCHRAGPPLHKQALVTLLQGVSVLAICLPHLYQTRPAPMGAFEAALLALLAFVLTLRMAAASFGRRSLRQRCDSGSHLIRTLLVYFPSLLQLAGFDFCSACPSGLLQAPAHPVILLIHGSIIIAIYHAIRVVLWEAPITDVVQTEPASVLLMLHTCAGVYQCLAALNFISSGWCLSIVLCWSAAFILGTSKYYASRITAEGYMLLAYVPQTLQLQQTDYAEPQPPLLHPIRPHLHCHFKIKGATPAHLHAKLRQNVLEIIQAPAESVIGSVHPGCILMSLSLRFNIWRHMTDAQANAQVPAAQWEAALLSDDAPAESQVIQAQDYQITTGAAPYIVDAQPTVLCPDTNITVHVKSNRIAGMVYQLRGSEGFHHLQVLQSEPLQGMQDMSYLVYLRIPNQALNQGLWWLEARQEQRNTATLLTSNSIPILLTHEATLADELNTKLVGTLSSSQVLGSIIEDIAEAYRHPNIGLPPTLLYDSVRLGLVNLVSHFASPTAFCAANALGEGLLSCAAGSCSLEMVQLVLSMMHVFNIPIQPHLRANPSSKLSALHWAARSGCATVIYALLSELPRDSQRRLWTTSTAGLSWDSPADILHRVNRDLVIDFELLADMAQSYGSDGVDISGASPDTLDELPSSPHDAGQTRISNAADRVWGVGLIAALRRLNISGQVLFPILYGCAILHTSWGDAMVWVAIVACALVLHVMAPYIHAQIYQSALETCREVVRSPGWEISQALSFCDRVKQSQYDAFCFAKQKGSKITHTMAMAMPMLCLLLSYVVLGGQVEGQRVPIILCVLGLAVLVPLHWGAMISRNFILQKWVELVAYCYLWLAALVSLAFRQQPAVWSKDLLCGNMKTLAMNYLIRISFTVASKLINLSLPPRMMAQSAVFDVVMTVISGLVLLSVRLQDGLAVDARSVTMLLVPATVASIAINLLLMVWRLKSEKRMIVSFLTDKVHQ